MEEKYKIVYTGGESEIVEKKSRFIASVFPVKTQEQAEELLSEIRKKYREATHHCYAYVIGEQQNLQRFSDDGEPQGTAGKPILEALLGENLHDTLIVVTRYFGGTLLGTGGLVRAYGRAAREGLNSSRVVERKRGAVYVVRTDYNGLGKLQYYCAQNRFTALDTEYTQEARLSVLVPEECRAAFEKEVADLTCGQAVLSGPEEAAFGVVEGRVVLLTL